MNTPIRIVVAGFSAAVILISCKSSKEKGFEVSGVITNSDARMVYLEELPANTMQREVVDSTVLGKDGKYQLKTGMGEARIYSIRLDKNVYPLASVVNDAPAITVNARFNDANRQFVETYDVKGSAGSQLMKDFMTGFNEGLQRIFFLNNRIDSLHNSGTPDSVLAPLMQEYKGIATSLKEKLASTLKQSTNPAVSMFVLGYYQSTANNMSLNLPGLTDEEVKNIVDEVAAKNPGHQGVASIKAALAAQQEAAKPVSWVGKQAPEIVLPDVNGKETTLSSFKGKYVLVDFWASWCGPCRQENPNVVNAFTKFNGKNFTVLGVSLDRPGQKDKWLQAIREDGLTWTHVSDLKYWSSPVVALYGFDGIPYNVLVDPEGKVIAEGLRGPELERKLQEVLH